jgi:ornithine--oxo-acid transaminase
LFCACEIYPEKNISFEYEGEVKTGAWAVTYKLLTLGVLAKPTHDNIIRLCPPLVINEEQVKDCLKIVKVALDSFD